MAQQPTLTSSGEARRHVGHVGPAAGDEPEQSCSASSPSLGVGQRSRAKHMQGFLCVF